MSEQRASLKEQLVGAWALVRGEVVAPDGARSPLVTGNDLAGQYIFTEDGHFSFQAVAEFGKFLSDNRLKTTPEENQAAVRGSIAYYGTYTVDEANRTILVHIERSSFPNHNGTDGKRVITTLSNDEMGYVNPGPRGGGAIHCTYKRLARTPR